MTIKILKYRIYLFALIVAIISLLSCSKDDSASGQPIDKEEVEENPDEPPYDDSKNYLGVNFNEQLEFVDFPMIEATETQWVRGFLEFFQLYNNPESLQTSDRVLSFKQLHPHGYNTILNIKFNFKNKDYPSVDSEEMNNYLDFLTELYDEVWEGTSIVVVGNEPFFETDPEDFDAAMYNFYVKVSEHTKAYNDTHEKKPIYFGAFDAMHHDYRQNNQVLLDLLEFVKNSSWIAGIDTHVHHDPISELHEAMDFVNSRIRDDQRILVTEFSRVRTWKLNLTTKIPPVFAQEYAYDPDTEVHEYVDYALNNPRPREEWVNFLTDSPWFENNKNLLVEDFEIFKNYDKFFIATYAYRQGFPINVEFNASSTPWILNSLYANRTVETDQFGKYQFNYNLINDFKSLQE